MVPVAAAVLCVVFGVHAPRALAAPKPPQGKHASEKQVEAIEEQWRQAQLTGDTSTIEKLLADDYIGITANGLINTKEQQLERMRNRTLMVTKMNVSDVKVKLYGSIAIVTSRVDLEGTNEGTSVTGVYRYTRVYKRSPNGAWKVTNFEATHITPPGTPVLRSPATPRPAPPKPGRSGNG
jgi:ketosteroid isomerase-like protein